MKPPTNPARFSISQPQLAFYEVGKRRVPVSMLPGLAKALGVSIEALIADNNTASIATAAPQRTRRGPVSRLEQQLDAVARMPKVKQKMVSEILGAMIAQHAG